MTGRTRLITVGLLLTACTACGSNAGKTPPGVTAHGPNGNATPQANRAGGTCQIFDKAEVQTAFGGTVSDPTADNLTPGSDRCTWTIHHSNLGNRDITLVATRNATPVVTKRAPATHAKKAKNRDTDDAEVRSVGPGAQWTPHQYALSWFAEDGPIGLQIIAGPGQRVDPPRALHDLTALARSTKP